MNAGKSTILLQSSYNYRERGMHTLVFSPQIDDRFGVGKVSSRIGLQSESIAISRRDKPRFSGARLFADAGFRLRGAVRLVMTGCLN